MRHRAAEEQMDQVIAFLGKIGPGPAQFVEALVGLVRRKRIRFDVDVLFQQRLVLSPRLLAHKLYHPHLDRLKGYGDGQHT